MKKYTFINEKFKAGEIESIGIAEVFEGDTRLVMATKDKRYWFTLDREPVEIEDGKEIYMLDGVKKSNITEEDLESILLEFEGDCTSPDCSLANEVFEDAAVRFKGEELSDKDLNALCQYFAVCSTQGKFKELRDCTVIDKEQVLEKARNFRGKVLELAEILK